MMKTTTIDKVNDLIYEFEEGNVDAFETIQSIKALVNQHGPGEEEFNGKICHLHLADGMDNRKTLICRVKNGTISYSFYSGSGSSGQSNALSNIQFYDLIDGDIHWNRNICLPVESINGESMMEFKQRIIDTLNHSTNKVIKEVNTNVKF